mmetsp:Transcript_11466/g.22772  ORF Transcript_11466/g.22772 Transcript_11466/m.22772 type:complete len:287 (-) Transcript_11466:211-1071(-)
MVACGDGSAKNRSGRQGRPEAALIPKVTNAIDMVEVVRVRRAKKITQVWLVSRDISFDMLLKDTDLVSALARSTNSRHIANARIERAIGAQFSAAGASSKISRHVSGNKTKARENGARARVCALTAPLKSQHVLDVARLREEVKGRAVGDDVLGVLACEEGRGVACLRGRVAADVDHARRREGEELGQELLGAPFARGVDHHTRRAGLKQFLVLTAPTTTSAYSSTAATLLLLLHLVLLLFHGGEDVLSGALDEGAVLDGVALRVGSRGGHVQSRDLDPRALLEVA